MATHLRVRPLLATMLVAASLGGCAHFPNSFGAAQLSDQECMARVMYFESNRSSDDGMLAVGTVVMNRLESPKYPKTVCGVVGQDSQFADGALTKAVSRRSQAWARAERVAASVLSGERHEGVGDAKFFHTAGYTFPYRNMHYVTLAGGNAFYEKKTPGTFTPGFPWQQPTMVASAEPSPRPERPLDPPALYAERKPERRPAEPLRERLDVRKPVMVADARPAAGPRANRSLVEDASFRPRPVTLAAVSPPPARPKPIVVAMLAQPPGRSAHAPRSIADLIEMDLKQQ